MHTLRPFWPMLLALFVATAPVRTAAQTNTVPNRVVIIDRNGSRPSTITRPSGKFVLFILNRLEPKDETFTLISVDRNGLASNVAPAICTDTHHDVVTFPVDLAPGEYWLSLRKHAWMAVKITITP